MNWEAIGALGEVIGALAMVVTLIFLVIQLRLNTKAMKESNTLERAIALDRHTDSVSRWRTTLAVNEGLTTLWYKALVNEPLTDVEGIRLNNLMVNFVNTQRSNFERALIVGENGLAVQASRSIAVEIGASTVLMQCWIRARPWHELASPEFVKLVDQEIEQHLSGTADFKSGSWIDVGHKMPKPV